MSVVGVSLWLNSFKRTNPSTIIKLAIANRLGLFEISIDYPWPYHNVNLLDEIVRLALDHNLRLGFHAPWRDLSLTTPYDVLGEAVVKVLIDSINYVQRLVEPSYIVVHPSTSQALEIIPSRYELIGKAVKRLQRICRVLRSNSMLIVENLSSGFSSDLDALINIIEETDCSNIGLCLDIGHLAVYYNKFVAHTNYYSSFYDYLEEVIDILRSSSIHVNVVHVHDVVDGNDHLVIGDGELDFKKIYRVIANINPMYIVFETFKSLYGRPSLEHVFNVVGVQKEWLNNVIT